ncbi:MAG TPA: hypothetical protein VJ483_08035 [Holophagaceae bacterium]|nr:hypothetical protein [Holophagaceae bacterium]
MRRALAVLFACAALGAQSQGRLRFASPGRAEIILDLVDGGHEAFLTIPHQRGDGEPLRLFVLSHTGPEAMVLTSDVASSPLRAPAPPAWKVDHKRGAARLRTAFGDFWRYTPGLVLPTRFTIGKVEWSLREAELPPKMLVSNGD